VHPRYLGSATQRAA
jgi:hypothetical protein